MTWTIVIMLIATAVAGAIGGLVNAFMTDNGFALPRVEKSEAGTIVRPGVFGNVGVGAVAAAISWGLYGPFASFVIVGNPDTGQNAPAGIGLSLASFVGAILVGIGGAKWLTSQVDNKLLKAAAIGAAGKIRLQVMLSSW